MKTANLILLAASLLAPAFAAAQAPAPVTAPAADAQKQKQDKKDDDAAKMDIQANAAAIAVNEGKLKDSHEGEKKALDASRAGEKSDLAAAARDGKLTKKAKKAKKAAILKDAKAGRQATRDQADAERKPLEKDLRLDKAAVKDDQTALDVKQAAEKK